MGKTIHKTYKVITLHSLQLKNNNSQVPDKLNIRHLKHIVCVYSHGLVMNLRQRGTGFEGSRNRFERFMRNLIKMSIIVLNLFIEFFSGRNGANNPNNIISVCQFGKSIKNNTFSSLYFETFLVPFDSSAIHLRSMLKMLSSQSL